MKNPKTIEVINFLHETDLLEAHLAEHAQFMDKIVVVESPFTYSGMPKPLYFQENKKRFEKYGVFHEVMPADLHVSIPGDYPPEEHKKWYDERRNNRERQQAYIFGKYKVGFDYLCNTDTDEIWSHTKWGRVQELMEQDMCYISPQVRIFYYFADAVAKKQDFWRITNSKMNTHVRQRGTKRSSTGIDIGWHFTTCHTSGFGLWMKGVGLAQSIGITGWKNVPSPEECERLIQSGVLPFVNQPITALKRVMPIDDISWLSPWLQENPTVLRWLPEQYRVDKPIATWRLDQ
jgi:hypothetical protein